MVLTKKSGRGRSETFFLEEAPERLMTEVSLPSFQRGK